MRKNELKHEIFKIIILFHYNKLFYIYDTINIRFFLNNYFYFPFKS